GWFPKKDILDLVTALFTKSNKNIGQFIRSKIDASQLISCKKEILRLMQELDDNLPEGAPSVFVNKLSTILHAKEGFDIDGLSDYFKREEPPTKKGCLVSAKAQGLWDKIREHLSLFCEIESGSRFNCYVDIFNYVLRNLEEIRKKEDILFLEALNKEAAMLFDGCSLDLPELYYRLAMRFQHFLLDEFQDTSILQWRNLHAMIAEALSTGGSFFYVGDKKQAIYRFRGGQLSLIDSVKDIFKDYNLIQRSLTHNYRSQKEIVEFNNKVFSEENLLRFLRSKEVDERAAGFSFEDINAIVGIFKGSDQAISSEKNKGFVKIEFIDKKIKAERDIAVKEKLLMLLTDLFKRFSFSDIAILCRKNKDVQIVTGWLLECNIPVESEITLNIRENARIKELISFLKFLTVPIDNLSFASFISGEIFSKATGLDSSEIQEFLFNLNNKAKKEGSIRSFAIAQDEPSPIEKNFSTAHLYRQFQERFPKIWDNFIAEFFKSAGFIPLYELLISILMKFDVMKNFLGSQGFFMRLLELIKEQEEKHFSIASFLEFFEGADKSELYVNVGEAEAVRVLTIHKSKGLEFGVVIIPFLEMELKIESQVVIPDEESGHLRLAYIKKSSAEYSKLIAAVRKEEYLKAFIDELNSVYVVLTRAKNELYVFVSPKAGASSNLANILLPENNLELGKKYEYKEKDSNKKAPALRIAPLRYHNWVDFLKEEFIDDTILKARNKLLRGEVLHYCLSFIGNLYQQERRSLIKAVLEKARLRFPLVSNFDEFELIIEKLLGKKELKHFFEVIDGDVYLEKEIVSSSGNTKRIDRLIVRPKEAVIIDYKSAKEEAPAYKEQVKEYMKVISEIYPKKKVKGFLVYLDDLSIMAL
ncbi:MAG: 3'-5' exonuclease, partial [Candidatus Omnitrophota bacterium]|nr:3'-5' exonuclease [Candidatus Omnitrophota bacterium]